MAPAAAAVAVGGAWVVPDGASSGCTQVATTTVSCEHVAEAGAGLTTGSCRSGAVGAGRLVVVATCAARLRGATSGAGLEQGNGGAPGCVTFGLRSGTLTFSDSTGLEYPPITVTIVNDGGLAEFSGELVNAAGVTVARTEGTFTHACGGASGAFEGTYETL